MRYYGVLRIAEENWERQKKIKAQNRYTPTILGFFTGPSGETWTHGLLTPSQARYQLRHTRIACQ